MLYTTHFYIATTLLSCAHDVVASPKFFDLFSNDIIPLSHPRPQKRADTCQDGTYQSPIGLDFKVSCKINIPLNDITPAGTNLTATDVYDCARQCSTARAMCFGASYNVPKGQCWLKTVNITTGFVLADNDTDTVVLSPTSQLSAGYATDCPLDEGSVQSTGEGMGYTVHCNRDINGYNFAPTNTTAPFPWHATSLSDCMSQCSTAQPLCAGVSYFPQMAQGYANCYPKTKLPSPLPSSLFITTTGAVVHSAVANIVYGNNTDCREGQIRQAAQNTNYVVSCNQDRTSGSIARFHATSLGDCLNSCATYSGSGGSCVATVFDSELTNGWQNCLLKNETGTPVTSNATDGFVFARLSNVADNTSNNVPDTSSSSKAWIAGPVVGAVIAIAALAAIFFLVRRRKRRNAAGAEVVSQADYKSRPVEDGRTPYNGYAYQGVVHGQGTIATAAPGELSSEQAKYELGQGRTGDEKFELQGSDRYAR